MTRWCSTSSGTWSANLDEFRAMSQQDQERGDVRSQRYTFTRFPFLDLSDGAVLALRAQWGMDGFFGNAPEFDVQQGFIEQGKPDQATQFQDAVKHQFEQIVGRKIARIAANSAYSAPSSMKRRCRPRGQ